MRSQPTATEKTPAERVVEADTQRILRTHLEAAFAELNPIEAEIVRLSVWEELSHAEIGEIVGIEPSLVRSRLYRGKQRLERALQTRDIAWSPDTKGSTTHQGDTEPTDRDQSGPE